MTAAPSSALLEKLAKAVSTNNIQLVDNILTCHPCLAHCRVTDGYGWPMVHRAAINGYAAMLRLLVAHGLPINDIQDDRTPFDMAVYSNHDEIVKQLIEMGVNVDENTDQDWLISLDLPGCFIKQQNSPRETPLQYAIRKNHTAIVTCIRTTWSKTAHQNLLSISLALAPLQLPAYVILWIIDWLPEYSQKPEIRKIRLIQGVTERRRLRV